MKRDFVIEIDAVGGPCWVASGEGDPGRTARIEHAERYATMRKADAKASALSREHPGRKFAPCQRPVAP